MVIKKIAIRLVSARPSDLGLLYQVCETERPLLVFSIESHLARPFPSAKSLHPIKA